MNTQKKDMRHTPGPGRLRRDELGHPLSEEGFGRISRGSLTRDTLRRFSEGCR
jgi:hypothetical protein